MTTFQRSGWSFGTNESAERTLKNMSARVRDCLKKSRLVVETANRVIAPVAPRYRAGQINAINDWLSHRFRFVSDPVGVELLRDPAGSIERIRERGFTQGDCDEAAMLAASLGMANGIPAQFRALAFGTPTAPYSHVVCDLQTDGGKWVPLDITKPDGFIVPPPSRVLSYKV